MAFADELYKAAAPIWEAQLKHPFVRGLGDGTLPPEAFRRWLRQDYGLDPLGATLLLQQTVRYEVGNVFDPAYTMVCKVPKAYLPGS